MQANDNDATENRSEAEPSPSRLSEQFRRECEARHVLTWPLEKRREYLAEVEKHRGVDGRQYLETEIRRQWEISGRRLRERSSATRLP